MYYVFMYLSIIVLLIVYYCIIVLMYYCIHVYIYYRMNVWMYSCIKVSMYQCINVLTEKLDLLTMVLCTVIVNQDQNKPIPKKYAPHDKPDIIYESCPAFQDMSAVFRPEIQSKSMNACFKVLEPTFKYKPSFSYYTI